MTTTETTSDDLLSPQEQAPSGAVREDPGTSECPHCGKSFGGLHGGRGALTLHVRFKHPDQAPAKAPAKKAPAKAPAKKAPAKAPARPAGKPPASPPPPPTPRRRPAGDTLGRLIGTLGRVLANVDPPTGRALRFEAPAAGVAIDRAVAGTVVDRIAVQKIVGVSERWEQLGSVISLPVIIFIIGRRPEMAEVFEEELREAMEDVLIASVPTMVRKAERSHRAAEALAKLQLVDPALAASSDPIGDLLRGFFAPPPAAPTGLDGQTE